MGRVSLPPPVCDTNLSQRVSFESNNLREASFSSYLNHAEQEFVRKLAESTRHRSNNSTITTTAQEQDEDHIEVFGAEKYFNGGINSPEPIKFCPENQKQSKKPKTCSSTRSEGSWNSQNGLLQSVNRKSSKEIKKKSSQLAKILLYKCYCCNNKSVEVKNNDKSHPTKSGINFTFQSSIPEATKNTALKIQIQGRKSIEVYGSPNVDALNMNHLEKRLSLMAWNDVVPRVKASDSDQIYDEDAGSDASSDLFEIESLTGNPNSTLTRQGSDCSDCVTPTAPSEASIEWSVTTASAADFSVVSDYDEQRLSTTAAAYMTKSSYESDVENIHWRRSNLLMGCKNQKAVRVADKYDSPAEVRRRTASFGRLMRFEADTKIMGFSSNQRFACTLRSGDNWD
ncbi:protein PHYTOCHROME KINASE SUBSTRATE 1-like [Cucurbita maxima]|uniref:Protein PHYTOCHROME KINASE SUBSTRATE 1-like n=1 Tax=Cucurbita maxima TaxID=3661 RepID=A0A6J1HTU2_CUCMA|nr:protein PHYTOCHROME KINASE SUBSTRATE 1-like [Cucurbita maxima]